MRHLDDEIFAHIASILCDQSPRDVKVRILTKDLLLSETESKVLRRILQRQISINALFSMLKNMKICNFSIHFSKLPIHLKIHILKISSSAFYINVKNFHHISIDPVRTLVNHESIPETISYALCRMPKNDDITLTNMWVIPSEKEQRGIHDTYQKYAHEHDFAASIWLSNKTSILATCYIGMGHYEVLAAFDKQLFCCHDGGANGWEQDSNFRTICKLKSDELKFRPFCEFMGSIFWKP